MVTPSVPQRSPHPPGIYLVAAHPHWRDSRITRRLFDATRTLDHVEVTDLYARYPDFDIDVPAEQARLAAAQLVVWLHPIQWYAMPALHKLWLDEVFAHGWAYGRGGGALRGKDLWLVTSTGGSEAAYHPSGYNRYFFDAFLPPYEQTAALCGMRFLPPLALHGAHAVDEASLRAHVEVFVERLASYPAWPEIEDLVCPGCDVPDTDRPRHGEQP